MSPINKTLYFGDNLRILKDYIPNDSVDLIYLDPPFNSNATYNVLFKEQTGEQSKAQIEAFDDTWHWTEESERTFQMIVDTAPADVVDMIVSFRKFIKKNDMMAYLVMMTIRLLELHRVLKPSGSIYLHCDQTASHYLKIILDIIFGKQNFRNEIIWCYSTSGRGKREFSKKHDTILFYSKTEDYFWNEEAVRIPYSDEYINSHFKDKDEQGRVCRKRFDAGKWRIYYPEKGMIPNDWWAIPYENSMSKERLGYPTQKPRILLERIIKASCPKNGIILDPFCGCGTTISASEHLNHQGYVITWLGIDVTHLAINLIKWRLKGEYGMKANKAYHVFGEPTDFEGAKVLASQDRYQFQWWALSLVNARPYGDKKRGADSGVDGYIYFIDPANFKDHQKAIVQVKSGNTQVKDIRDLKAVIEREHSPIGIFITLHDPTYPMRKEAAEAGFYNGKIPKIQILTIQDILEGKKCIQIPLQVDFVKKADRVQTEIENLPLF